MKLTFEQTQADVFDLSKHSLKNNRMIKILIVVLLLFFLVTSINFTSGFSMRDLLSGLLPLVLIGIIWYFLIKYILKKRFQNTGDQQIMTGKREITLTEEGVHVWAPVSETNYQWSAITKLEESTKNYFLFLGKSQAVLVSKSAFKDQAQMAEFETLVSSKIS